MLYLRTINKIINFMTFDLLLQVAGLKNSGSESANVVSDFVNIE